MKILIVVATAPEIAPLLGRLQYVAGNEGNQGFKLNNSWITVVTTGVGMAATAAETAFHLGRFNYDLIINAGICGAFNRDLKIGDVVNVQRDCIPELGVEDHDKFISAFDLGIEDRNQNYYRNGWLELLSYSKAFSHLKKCSGLTVNTGTGSVETISQLEKFGADVETMEGAGFVRAAKQQTVAAVQIRAVSNYVEPRDRSKWNLPLAIANLNEVLYTELNALTK
jgi:futalosine hydrolase